MFGLRADRLVLKNLGRQYGQNTRIFRRSAHRADDRLSLVGWKVLQGRLRALAVDGASCVSIDFAYSHSRVLRGTMRWRLRSSYRSTKRNRSGFFPVKKSADL
jgi:hypothetical protein